VIALPHADEERDAARFEEWVRAGRAGTMRYLERTELAQEGEAARLLRSRAGIPFPWARSVLVCLVNYNSQQPRSTDRQPKEQVGLRLRMDRPHGDGQGGGKRHKAANRLSQGAAQADENAGVASA